MNEKLRQELLNHLEASKKTRTSVANAIGISLSNLSHFLKGRSNLSLKVQKRLDDYLAEVNERPHNAPECFMDIAELNELRRNSFIPGKRVEAVIALRDLMTDRDYDERYKVYFYADKTFDITNLFGDDVLAEKKQSVGYRGYSVRVVGDKENRTIASHRIIATYYHPNPENKPEVNHIDGIKNNNHPDNLEWVTRKENAQHAHDTGLVKNLQRGENHFLTTLTKEDVSTIYLHVFYGKSTQTECAEAYGVSIGVINNICRNKTWKSVTDKPITVDIDALIKPLSELRTS